VVAAGFETAGGSGDAAVWTNNEWPPLPQTVDLTPIPVPTDGPTPIDDPAWSSNPYVFWGIAALVLVVVSVRWALARQRK